MSSRAPKLSRGSRLTWLPRQWSLAAIILCGLVLAPVLYMTPVVSGYGPESQEVATRNGSAVGLTPSHSRNELQGPRAVQWYRSITQEVSWDSILSSVKEALGRRSAGGIRSLGPRMKQLLDYTDHEYHGVDGNPLTAGAPDSTFDYIPKTAPQWALLLLYQVNHKESAPASNPIIRAGHRAHKSLANASDGALEKETNGSLIKDMALPPVMLPRLPALNNKGVLVPAREAWRRRIIEALVVGSTSVVGDNYPGTTAQNNIAEAGSDKRPLFSQHFVRRSRDRRAILKALEHLLEQEKRNATNATSTSLAEQLPPYIRQHAQDAPIDIIAPQMLYLTGGGPRGNSRYPPRGLRPAPWLSGFYASTRAATGNGLGEGDNDANDLAIISRMLDAQVSVRPVSPFENYNYPQGPPGLHQVLDSRAVVEYYYHGGLHRQQRRHPLALPVPPLAHRAVWGHGRGPGERLGDNKKSFDSFLLEESQLRVQLELNVSVTNGSSPNSAAKSRGKDRNMMNDYYYESERALNGYYDREASHRSSYVYQPPISDYVTIDCEMMHVRQRSRQDGAARLSSTGFIDIEVLAHILARTRLSAVIEGPRYCLPARYLRSAALFEYKGQRNGENSSHHQSQPLSDLVYNKDWENTGIDYDKKYNDLVSLAGTKGFKEKTKSRRGRTGNIIVSKIRHSHFFDNTNETFRMPEGINPISREGNQTVIADGPSGEASIDGDGVRVLRALLWRHAPSWAIGTIWRKKAPEATDTTAPRAGGGYRVITRIALVRRIKAFHFAITGGGHRELKKRFAADFAETQKVKNRPVGRRRGPESDTAAPDIRAAYVEQTWGQRTPLLWFADRWLPSLRPRIALHPSYRKRPFVWLSYKISRIWETVFKEYHCLPPLTHRLNNGAAFDIDEMRTGTGQGGEPGQQMLNYYTLAGAARDRRPSAAYTYEDAIDMKARYYQAYGLSHDPIQHDDFIPPPPRGCPTTAPPAYAAYLSRIMSDNQKGSDLGGGRWAGLYRQRHPLLFSQYDWYIRLWDDNYYLEESLYNSLFFVSAPRSRALMLGKSAWSIIGTRKNKRGAKSHYDRALIAFINANAISWGGNATGNNGDAIAIRNGGIGAEDWLFDSTNRSHPSEGALPSDVLGIYPFTGGGAGWFLSRRGLQLVGPSFSPRSRQSYRYAKATMSGGKVSPSEVGAADGAAASDQPSATQLFQYSYSDAPYLELDYSDNDMNKDLLPLLPDDLVGEESIANGSSAGLPAPPGYLGLSGEEWFHHIQCRAVNSISVPYQLHNEDTFLTAWFHLVGIGTFALPGVEHVSPGPLPKQRCVPPSWLRAARWGRAPSFVKMMPGLSSRMHQPAGDGTVEIDQKQSFHLLESDAFDLPGNAMPFYFPPESVLGAENSSLLALDLSAARPHQNTFHDPYSVFFEYASHDGFFSAERGARAAFVRPVVWHYMSPKRLIWLERLLTHHLPNHSHDWEQRIASPSSLKEGNATHVHYIAHDPPLTDSDKLASKSIRKRLRAGSQCYLGGPQPPLPPVHRGHSIFELVAAEIPLVVSIQDSPHD